MPLKCNSPRAPGQKVYEKCTKEGDMLTSADVILIATEIYNSGKSAMASQGC